MGFAPYRSWRRGKGLGSSGAGEEAWARPSIGARGGVGLTPSNIRGSGSGAWPLFLELRIEAWTRLPPEDGEETWAYPPHRAGTRHGLEYSMNRMEREGRHGCAPLQDREKRHALCSLQKREGRRGLGPPWSWRGGIGLASLFERERAGDDPWALFPSGYREEARNQRSLGAGGEA